MSDYFDELVSQLRRAHLAIDTPYLHGLLTGFSTTPDADPEKLYPEITGSPPLAESLQQEVINAVGCLSGDLSVQEFRARFRPERDNEAERWINGYIKAVEIHEDRWREENDCHPKAGAALILLQSLIDEESRQVFNFDQSGYQELREDPTMVTDLAIAIYQRFHGDHDDEFDLFNEELPVLRGYSKEELAGRDEAALFALVTANDDRLPLEVVHECANRMDAMVVLLHRHLENDANWSNDVSEGDWWGLLHAVFILGLIPGEASSRALLEGFRRITFDSDNNMADWVSGYWPALCRNKTEYTSDVMRQIAEDRELDWYPRSHAAECIVAAAPESVPKRIEAALDWLAALCGDESQDTEFRVTAAQHLLDQPRDRHRRLMEDLVDIQDKDSWFGVSFDQDDVDRAFVKGDAPEWKRFGNPWRFYEPGEIQRRQSRWNEEAREGEQEKHHLDEWKLAETFVREDPKIGRNDPCPCGSGKKYKKCCINNLH